MAEPLEREAMGDSCEKVMGQCEKVKEYCEDRKEECDKKAEPGCEEFLGKCDRAGEQCAREMKEACGKPMEPIEEVLGAKPWLPDLSAVDRHIKKMDPGSTLMAGSGILLGGLAIMGILLGPLLDSSGNLPTPLIPALPGFPGPQSLFLPPPKLENHENCGKVGGGKVGTLSIFSISSILSMFSIYFVSSDRSSYIDNMLLKIHSKPIF